MLVKPIPIKLLSGECVLKKPVKGGVYGGKYTTAAVLRNVRIEENRKGDFSGSNEKYAQYLVLYYDSVNSLPHNVEIDVGDVVEYKGGSYRVENARYVMAADKVHHIRAVLI